MMLNKILSGRFIFTIVAAMVFMILSIRGTLSTDKVMEVILIVIYAYFNKPRPNEGQK
jgi:hypothetical protein